VKTVNLLLSDTHWGEHREVRADREGNGGVFLQKIKNGDVLGGDFRCERIVCNVAELLFRAFVGSGLDES
jgi:hypothetical protein